MALRVFGSFGLNENAHAFSLNLAQKLLTLHFFPGLVTFLWGLGNSNQLFLNRHSILFKKLFTQSDLQSIVYSWPVVKVYPQNQAAKNADFRNPLGS